MRASRRGIYISDDAAANWHLARNMLYDSRGVPDFLHLSALPGGRLLAIIAFKSVPRGGLVMTSGDGGVSWEPIGDGITQGEITDYGTTDNGDFVLIAENITGRYSSTDKGRTWEALGSALVPPTFRSLVEIETGRERSVLAHPLEPRVLLGVSRTGVEITRDGGRYWEYIDRDLGTFEETLMFFDQDDPNQLYLGTESGLYGLRFPQTPVPFPEQPEARLDTLAPRGKWEQYVPGSNVYDLEPDGRGGVWIEGTQLEHIYDGETSSYTTDTAFYRPNTELSSDGAGNLWISFLMSRFGDANWEHFAVETLEYLSDLSSIELADVLVRSDGDVWFGTTQYQGTGSGLFRLRDGTVERILSDALMNDHNINAIVDGPDGRLWVCTGGSGYGTGIGGGLAMYDGSTWQGYGVREGIAHPYVFDIAFDLQGTAWLATGGGLIHFMIGDGFGLSYTPENSPILDTVVNAVAVDAAGAVWTATNLGVNRFDGSHWTTYRKADGLLDDEVRDVLAGPDGRMWFATNSGVSVLDYGLETAVAEQAAVGPTTAELHTNYLNPFNSSTIIDYRVGAQTLVELTVFDVLGQSVRRLVSDQLPAGNYHAHWDGKDDLGRTVGSGVYLYRLLVGDFERTRRMVLVK